VILFVRLLIACSNLGAIPDLAGLRESFYQRANCLFIDKKTISPPVPLQAFSVALTNHSYVSNLEHLVLNGLVCNRGPIRNCYSDRPAITRGYLGLGN
jgi:hypothetical protein